MRFLVLLLLLSSSSVAQLQVTTKVVSQIQFTATPRLVGSTVLFDPKTKGEESVIAFVTVRGPAETLDIVAERLSIVDGQIIVEAADVKLVGDREYSISGSGTYTVSIIGFGPGISRHPRYSVTLEPPKPPIPPKPPEPPTPNPPEPVKSFRVILVKESGSTLTGEQTSIAGAKLVREYLTNKTTPEGGNAGWREYDPQQNVTNERSKIKEMWLVAKSSITTVPCMIIEVNGKVTILNYPKNVAEAIKTLKTYGGE